MNDLPNVKGLAELKRSFDGIVAESKKRVLRKMGSGGGKYMRDAVRTATPVGKGPTRKKGTTRAPGTLKKSAFYFFARKDSNPGQAVFRVSYRQKTGYYAAWVDSGHRIVGKKGPKKTTIRARRAASNARVPAHPFFEQAVTGAAARTIEVMVEAGTAEMQKIVSEKT